MTDSLESLMDRAAIADLVAGLAHAQDDRNWEGMRQLFADEVHLDMSRQSNGPVLDLTAAQLADMAQETLEGFDCTHHMTANLEVRLEGDTARCRVHAIAYHHVPADTGVVDFCTMRGYWHLELYRLERGWRIARWAIERAAAWEGDPAVYQLAAARRAELTQ